MVARTLRVTLAEVSLDKTCFEIFVSSNRIVVGLWAGTVGTQRLLKLFDKYKIKATWFIPGELDRH